MSLNFATLLNILHDGNEKCQGKFHETQRDAGRLRLTEGRAPGKERPRVSILPVARGPVPRARSVIRSLARDRPSPYGERKALFFFVARGPVPRERSGRRNRDREVSPTGEDDKIRIGAKWPESCKSCKSCKSCSLILLAFSPHTHRISGKLTYHTHSS